MRRADFSLLSGIEKRQKTTSAQEEKIPNTTPRPIINFLSTSQEPNANTKSTSTKNTTSNICPDTNTIPITGMKRNKRSKSGKPVDQSHLSKRSGCPAGGPLLTSRKKDHIEDVLRIALHMLEELQCEADDTEDDDSTEDEDPTGQHWQVPLALPHRTSGKPSATITLED